MGRPAKSRTLNVWMNGEQVGRWTATTRAEHRFEYAPSWLDSENARPLSLSMPLRPSSEPYVGRVVEMYFENLLPDSFEVRRQLMARYGTDSDQPISLLAEIGRDCVGAVQLLPPDIAPNDVRRVDGITLSEERVAKLLEDVRRTGMALPDDGEFRISLAGNQEKVALLRRGARWLEPKGSTPTTHILKLPIGQTAGIDLTHSIENEWLCAQLLAALAIPVARCEPARFGDEPVLVVERFDRHWIGGQWIARLPQEDFCQATSTPSSLKYEKDGGPGIEAIMSLLVGSSNPDDRADFFRTQVLFWLLCAIDGHAKNFSVFLEAGGGFRLTPRYDVLSAFPVLGHGLGKLPEQRVKMAMAVRGRNRHYRWHEIHVRHWEETAKRCHLTGARELIADLTDRIPPAVISVRKALPKGFPTAVGRPILDGLWHASGRAREMLNSKA